MDSTAFRIGICAPSSVVGATELQLGTEFLNSNGFETQVSPQCAARYYTFAGTDEQRATALFDLARDPAVDAVWAARGGYGAARLLPILDRMTKEFSPPPPKLLVGYSDTTLLHEFVKKAWGWQTLHAPMLASDLRHLPPEQWDAIASCVRGRWIKLKFAMPPLRWITPPPAKPIRAELIGGNLSLWSSLAGTRYQPRGRRRILFFEDVSEPPYRIDRMFQQIVQSGMIDGAAAIVLGDFTKCEDEALTCLAEPANEEQWSAARANPMSAPRKTVREPIELAAALDETFGTVGRRLGIPVAAGLPVGHGPNFWPLPLGARYALRPEGVLELWKWDWFKR